MDKREEIVNLLLSVSEKVKEEYRIPCSVALQIAMEHDVAPEEIGKICDEEGIRIVKCRLGCF